MANTSGIQIATLVVAAMAVAATVTSAVLQGLFARRHAQNQWGRDIALPICADYMRLSIDIRDAIIDARLNLERGRATTPEAQEAFLIMFGKFEGLGRQLGDVTLLCSAEIATAAVGIHRKLWLEAKRASDNPDDLSDFTVSDEFTAFSTCVKKEFGIR